MDYSRLKVYGLSKSFHLAEKIQRILDETLDTKLFEQQGDYNLLKFSDGEFQPQFNSCVRGDTVFLVQSTAPNSDSLMELVLAIDAMKRASAKHIVAVIPYFGWARQDRKDRPRIPIGAKVVANMLQNAGCDRVITIDLHCDQIQGFFDIPVDHLYADTVLSEIIPRFNSAPWPIVVVAPDMGAAKRATRYAKLAGVNDIAFSYKHRSKANEIDELKIVGDVKGKLAVICDDMVDTAGTLCKVADTLKKQGAESVYAIATHGVLSGPALDRLEKSAISGLYILDTIDREGVINKLSVWSCSNLLATTIRRVYEEKSIVI